MNTRLALTVIVLAACREASSDSERVTHTVVAPPCAECTLDVPDTVAQAVPLLVVLHGDKETAADAVPRWREAALARGIAVLGLTCPRDRGCTDGRWYAWTETPSFVATTLATLARDVELGSVYLAGWSGGASVIGKQLAAWTDAKGLVIHGGGQAPPNGSCGTQPTYFLVGDANPDHRSAIALRDHLSRCGQPFAWDVLPRAGHADEKRALDRAKADHILAWLTAHTAR